MCKPGFVESGNGKIVFQSNWRCVRLSLSFGPLDEEKASGERRGTIRMHTVGIQYCRSDSLKRTPVGRGMGTPPNGSWSCSDTKTSSPLPLWQQPLRFIFNSKQKYMGRISVPLGLGTIAISYQSV